MKQKLLLIFCLVMLVLEAKAETYNPTTSYTYSTTQGTYFINNYDILRVLDTPSQIAGGYISNMYITKIAIDGTEYAISAFSFTETTTYRRYYGNGLDIYFHNTSRTNCESIISSATFDSNRSNDYQYGFNISYNKTEAKIYDIYGFVTFYYGGSPYERTFHLRISPNSSFVNAVRFTSNTSNATAQTSNLTAYTGNALTLYTYSPSSITRTYSKGGANSSYVTLSSNSVNGTGYNSFTATCTKPGTYTVTVSQTGGDGYFPSTATRTVNVIRCPNDLSMSNATITIPKSGVASQTLASLKSSGSSTGSLSYSFNTVSSSTGATLVQGTDYYISNGVFYAKKAGTYKINVTQAQTDYYESGTKTITITVYDMPDILSVLNVKPNEDLDLISAIKNYKPVMSPAFSCDDANATVSGTTFSSAVEGEYFVNVSTQGSEYIESKEAQVRVVVSKHNHGKITLHLHYDDCGVIKVNQLSRIACNHKCYFIPEWDFRATVTDSHGDKNVRFCINDDGESVTLVSGVPVGYMSGSFNMMKISDYDTHTPVSSHGTPCSDIDFTYNIIQTFNFNDPQKIDYEKGVIGSSSTIPLLEEQNSIIYHDVVDFYNIDGDLTIPEYVNYDGKDYKVTEIGDNAFEYSGDFQVFDYYDERNKWITARIDKLHLPTSIQRIGVHAFDIANNYLAKNQFPLKSVNFTDLENLKRIDGYAFASTQIEYLDLTRCSQLESLGDGAFYNCPSLKEVNMSGLQNFSAKRTYAHRTDWTSTFKGCSALTNVDLSDMPQLNAIGNYLFSGCKTLKIDGLKLDNTPITEFETYCFNDCSAFSGGVFDLRKLRKVHDDGYESERPIKLYGICERPVRAIISNHELMSLRYTSEYPFSDPVHIFMLHPKARFEFIFKTFPHNVTLYAPYEKVFINEKIDCSKYFKTSTTFDENADNHGPRIYPILRAKSSEVRTMSYFRPLDYKNIKVFDNTHIYAGNKSDDTDYELEDFFRSPENIADNNIEMLTPYIATSYDVETNQVTMTQLSDAQPGIEALGGVYYKGKGTAADEDDNEILYILTQPEYTGSESEKTYTNMCTATNYLKGGGKDAVNLSGAPHMTDESTQYISKNGEFHYCTGGTLAPYKAYLDIPEKILTIEDPGFTGNPRPGSSNAKGISIVFKDYYDDIDEQDDQTTGVHGAVVNAKDVNTNDNDWYNMQGMKVQNPRRGVFVNKNGNKAMFK